jgi:hypothetical protein
MNTKSKTKINKICWFCDKIVLNKFVTICDQCYNERYLSTKKIKKKNNILI